MKFSFSQWELCPQDKTIEFLKSEGVKFVEPGPDFLLKFTENEIINISEKYKTANINFYSIHAPFAGENDLSNLDTARRTKAVAILKEFISRASLANIKCLIIHPGDFIGNDCETTRLKEFEKSMETLLPLAINNNLLLAVENMPPTSAGSSIADILKIVNKFDSKNIGICFDTGHVNISNENILTALDEASDKIIAFHFHDNDGERDLHLQPPYGTIDWKSLIKTISKYNYNFPALVEAKPWNNSSPSQLLKEVELLFSGNIFEMEIGGKTANVFCEKCKHFFFVQNDEKSCYCDVST